MALSRPWLAESVSATIRRQTHSAEWVVVENGPAVGSFAGGALRLRSAQSAGAARNAALDYARVYGFDWVSFFDDDDYYGPGYVAEVAAEIAAGDADAFHKGVGFVRFDDALWLFDSPTRHVMANTLTVRSAVAPEFLELAEPEEPAWTRMAAERGLRVRRLPPWHHIWNRSGDPAAHVFKGGRAALRASFGESILLGDKPDEFVDSPRSLAGLPAAGEPTAEELFADLERYATGSGWVGQCF